jgi:branched-chain amino acid transport system ATP-binding protein
MNDAALTVSSVSMAFKGFKALSDVSLTVPDSSATAIVGPNGAGKTTLLNCICGIYRPASGGINLGNQSLLGRFPHEIAQLGIARTFQSVEQIRVLTVLEMAMLGAHRARRAGFLEVALTLPRARQEESADRQAALMMLDELNIAAFALQRLETAPYAVRKLADLARSLVARPTVLLLDEPSAGMSMEEKQQLNNSLLKLRGKHYRTLVIVDHDIQFLQNVCERTVVLDFGRKIAEGPTRDVLTDPEVVEAYLGLPVETNNGF